ALLDRYLAEEHEANPKDFEPLRKILSLAPNWARPRGLLQGEGIPADEALDALATAVLLEPSNDETLGGYAGALAKIGRYHEAHRHADRAGALAPWDAGHQVTAIEATTEMCREGFKLADASRRIEELRQA